jgi:hypothetical protein
MTTEVEIIVERVKNLGDAIARIGNETRQHEVHISDIQRKLVGLDQTALRSNEALGRLTSATEQLTNSIDKQQRVFQEHLLKDAHDEAKIGRQAIWLWASAIVGGAGWIIALLGGEFAKLITGAT